MRELVPYRDLIQQRVHEQERQGSLFETMPDAPRASQGVQR